jgi:hypothetical protein
MNLAKQIESLKRHDIVRIDWVDACGSGTWRAMNDFETEGPKLLRSVGLVVARNSGALTITTTTDFTVACIAPVLIPLVCIREVRKLGRLSLALPSDCRRRE